MPANSLDFQKSITQELEIVKNRVRHLIQNRHWGEEGAYKEAILKNVLRKYLPRNISVGSGFIMGSEADGAISRQLDIILYDNTYPLLFSEGDFVITTKTNVRGIIEVKTSIASHTFQDILRKFEETMNILDPLPIYSTNQNDEIKTRVFLGLFSYAFEGRPDPLPLARSLGHSAGHLNHISLGKDFFIRRWHAADGPNLPIPQYPNSDFYNFYELPDLSFSYFISNLLDIVSGGLQDRYWFSFPIEGTKEMHRIGTVEIEHEGA
ncbi:MAG: DUF6602 domain-containing protein [Chitinophagaceae bacterium]